MDKKRAGVEVRIKYKTENCNDLCLKLSGIGECGEVISADTFRLSACRGVDGSPPERGYGFSPVAGGGS